MMTIMMVVVEVPAGCGVLGGCGDGQVMGESVWDSATATYSGELTCCSVSVYTVDNWKCRYQCQSNSSMHRYECVALCKDISLQRGQLCTGSLASCIPRSSKDRSSWMFFIQVVHGRPGGRLQFSGGGLKMPAQLGYLGTTVWDTGVVFSGSKYTRMWNSMCFILLWCFQSSWPGCKQVQWHNYVCSCEA